MMGKILGEMVFRKLSVLLQEFFFFFFFLGPHLWYMEVPRLGAKLEL